MTATIENASKPKASATTLRIPRHELLHAVGAASKGIASRGVRPVLSNVRIGDGLVTGTDLELRIDVAIGEVCDPFLVPADRLLAMLRAATADTVTLKASGSSVVVKCGGSTWTLPTEDVAEFPAAEVGELPPLCRLPADQFARSARATVYAADNGSSRFALGGVLIEVAEGVVTWVGTDGRRLSLVEMEIDQDPDNRQVIVPSRVMAVVQGFAHGDGSVQVTASGTVVVFELDDGITVTGRLVEGRYPRWRDVVGEPEGTASVLDVQELLRATEAAAIVASEQSRGVHLTWTADTLVLSGKSAERGESTVKCRVVSAGTTSATKLDPAFVREFLRGIPGDEEPQVHVFAADPGSRVLLRCGPYTGVIMPLAEET
jgi:DNA polymerase III subunit beta